MSGNNKNNKNQGGVIDLCDSSDDEAAATEEAAATTTETKSVSVAGASSSAAAAASIRSSPSLLSSSSANSTTSNNKNNNNRTSASSSFAAAAADDDDPDPPPSVAVNNLTGRSKKKTKNSKNENKNNKLMLAMTPKSSSKRASSSSFPSSNSIGKSKYVDINNSSSNNINKNNSNRKEDNDNDQILEINDTSDSDDSDDLNEKLPSSEFGATKKQWKVPTRKSTVNTTVSSAAAAAVATLLPRPQTTQKNKMDNNNNTVDSNSNSPFEESTSIHTTTTTTTVPKKRKQASRKTAAKISLDPSSLSSSSSSMVKVRQITTTTTTARQLQTNSLTKQQHDNGHHVVKYHSPQPQQQPRKVSSSSSSSIVDSTTKENTFINTSNNSSKKKKKINDNTGTSISYADEDDEIGYKFFKRHCWKCEVQLRHPDEDKKDEESKSSKDANEDNAIMCCYALHEHPIFKIPVCCICSQDVASSASMMAMETSSSSPNNNNNNSNNDGDDNESINSSSVTEHEVTTTFCSLCGTHEEDVEHLFLCDNNNINNINDNVDNNDNAGGDKTNNCCQRGICDVCIEKVYESQPGMVEELLNSDDPWKCCFCKPPKLLQKLQRHLQSLKETETKDGEESSSSIDKTTKIEQLLEELQCVETKKRQCEEELENSEGTRRNIYDEAMSKNELTEVERHNLAEQDYKIWMLEQENHDRRLEDMIATLRDDLERRGFDLYQLQHYREELVLRHNGDEADGDAVQEDEEEEPDWKLAADLVVGNRIEQKKKLLAKLDLKEKCKKDCITRLAKSAAKKREIHQKLLQADNGSSTQQELSNKVQEEFEKWYVSEKRKQRKLNHEVNSIYEQFESCGINHEEYIRTKESSKVLQPNGGDDDDSEEIIEDLGSLGSEDEIQHRSMEELERRLDQGWVTGIVSQQEFKAAKRAEDAAAAASKRSRRNLVAIADADDQKEMDDEDYLRGANAVRSDHVFLHQIKRNEEKLAADKKRRRRQGRGKREHSIAEASAIEGATTTDDDDDDSSVPAARASSASKYMFEGSELILSEATNETYPIAVASSIAKKLKQHQRDGIEFMFQNCFSDLKCKGDQSCQEKISGCILAHNMGLGKSFACVALLQTLLSHPSFNPPVRPKRAINTVLLLVPTVTVTNWEDEFEKWVGHQVAVYTLDSSSSRKKIIRNWQRSGGVLLMSIGIFLNMTRNEDVAKYLQRPGPDCIVLDEAHQMLKNKENKTFRALEMVQTKRRICLTGSPFQNNLLEYFRMVSFVKEGVLGTKEREFERHFVNPIHEGAASDASHDQQQLADEKLALIQELTKPYVHRVDRTALLRDLPNFQQVTLHFRQTKVQSQLYSAFKKNQKRGDNGDSNFFKIYHALRPIHNHPGCLLEKSTSERRSSTNNAAVASAASAVVAEEAKPAAVDKAEKTKKQKANASTSAKKGYLPSFGSQAIIDLISDDEDDDATVTSKESCSDSDKPWYENRKNKDTELTDVINGNKIVMLLHLLYHADIIGDKVVVFSQCLKTHDFLAKVFALPDWFAACPSLADAFPVLPGAPRPGGWRPGKEFLRIDGRKTATERGQMISDFNDDIVGKIKCFLISPKAGGVGINLCAANRVVLLDSNFNPSTDEQALYRCYRYGQKKDVFCYRFLVEGTMEEKVYTRAVSKSSLALRLLDGKNISRIFTRKEMDNFTKVYDWVQCDSCEKWRVLPPDCDIDVEKLPDKWFCYMMNEHDKRMKLDCNFGEKDQAWYDIHFSKPNEAPPDVQSPGMRSSAAVVTEANRDLGDTEKQKKLTDKDVILKKLLDVTGNETQSTIVSRHYFHDVLLSEKELDNPVSSKGPKDSQVPALPTENNGLSETVMKPPGQAANQSGARASSEKIGSLLRANIETKANDDDDDDDDNSDIVVIEMDASSSKPRAMINKVKARDRGSTSFVLPRPKSNNNNKSDDGGDNNILSTPSRRLSKKRQRISQIDSSTKEQLELLRSQSSSASMSPAAAKLPPGTPDTVATASSTTTAMAANTGRRSKRAREHNGGGDEEETNNVGYSPSRAARKARLANSQSPKRSPSSKKKNTGGRGLSKLY